jgi:hypothetical protein
MVAVISAFVAAAMSSTGNTARLSDRSRDYAAARTAAEGAVEYAFSQWKSMTNNANSPLPTSTIMAGLTAPSFPGFAYASTAPDGLLRVDALDQYGVPADTATPVSCNLPSYPGWSGMVYNYMARAKMQMASSDYQFGAGVKRQFQYTVVPLFQSMFFFEDNIEIYRPAPMIVNGPVHTNANAYLSGSSAGSLTFQSNVSYSQSYTDSADPPYANTWSGWQANAEIAPIYTTGQASQLHQVPRMEPLGTDLTTAISTADTNPNNDSIHEIIEPPNPSYADPAPFANNRLYNKAGLVININGGTTTVSGQNGITLDNGHINNIKKALSAKTAIYDQREGASVDVTSVDIGQLTQALNGVKGFNNVVYIYDTTALTAADQNPKAIRLTDGGVLPAAGLTVASENPVYVQGDYNTGTTKDPAAVPSNVGNVDDTASPTVSGYNRAPAAVIGDAVILLSNNWSDANSSQTLGSRVASDTTYNMAIVSGFMPSGYQPATGSQYGYSGGANNFPRFLEDWTNQYCTYYGSMVELYQSKIFTGQWDSGVIYRPPIRCWNFDTNFNTAPPPGSLNAVTWSRGTWAKY